MATTRRRRARETTSAPYDPMLPLIRVAQQQIDAEPGGRLAWLLKFIREEPAGWQPGDREAHGNRLLAFVYKLPPNMLALREPVQPLAPADVEILHGELGEWLRQLVSAPAGASVPVPREGLEEAMVRATKPGEKPAKFGLSWGGPRRTMLFQAVKALILETDGRLIACQECGAPILALRKRLFCPSPNPCLQKWHDREKAKRRGRERAR